MSKESLHNIGAAPKKQLIKNNQWISRENNQQSRIGVGRTGTDHLLSDSQTGTDHLFGDAPQPTSSTHIMEHVHEPEYTRRARPIPDSIKQTLIHRVENKQDDGYKGDMYKGQADPYRGQREPYEKQDTYRDLQDSYVSPHGQHNTQNMNRYNTELDQYHQPYNHCYTTTCTDPSSTPSYTHSYPDIITSADPYNQGIPPAKPPRVAHVDESPVAAHYLTTVSGRYVCAHCENPLGKCKQEINLFNNN